MLKPKLQSYDFLCFQSSLVGGAEGISVINMNIKNVKKIHEKYIRSSEI